MSKITSEKLNYSGIVRKFYKNHIPYDVFNISDDEHKDIIYKILVDNCPPEGISQEFWSSLTNSSDKDLVLNAVISLDNHKCSKNVVKRVFDRLDSSDVEPAINALALICALVLTVPFGMSFDLVSMKAALSNCDSDSFFIKSGLTWKYTESQILSNWSCTVYGSMVGLIIACIYYILKQDEAYAEEWFDRKGRFLLLAMFCTTAAAIISIMNLSSDILNFVLVADDDLCEINVNPYIVPGIAILSIGLCTSIWLMI